MMIKLLMMMTMMMMICQTLLFLLVSLSRKVFKTVMMMMMMMMMMMKIGQTLLFLLVRLSLSRKVLTGMMSASNQAHQSIQIELGSVTESSDGGLVLFDFRFLLDRFIPTGDQHLG